jgi:hypothetical protein
MYNLRIFLAVVALGIASNVFSQVIPGSNTPKVDSAMINPDAKKDPAFNPKRDSVVNLKSARPREQKPAVVKDSARLALERLPRQAVVRSAIVPGLGQIKNGRWWKVPFIYGGFVGLGLIIDFNHRYYKDILSELQFRRNNIGQTSTSIYANFDDQSLISAKDYYRRTRDLSFLACGALYAINLIDAYVDAKFFRYDISDDLAIKIYPSLTPQLSYAYTTPAPALKIKISL